MKLGNSDGVHQRLRYTPRPACPAVAFAKADCRRRRFSIAVPYLWGNRAIENNMDIFRNQPKKLWIFFG